MFDNTALNRAETEIPKDDKIAVCVHAFYPAVFARIAECLSQSPDYVDIFVSCNENKFDDIANISTEKGVKATIFTVDNIGMDIFPFLLAINKFRLHEYLAVVKLHTKSDASPEGAVLGNLMLKRTYGRANTIDQLHALFKESDVALAGPNDTFKNVHYQMYKNRPAYRDLSSLLEIGYRSDIGFFGGTMFWIRGELLRPLIRHFTAIERQVYADARKLERTGGDGSIAHAFERIFCALAATVDPTIALIYQRDIEDTQDIIRADRQSVLLSEPIRRIPARDMVPIYVNGSKNALPLRDNPLFDAEFYDTQITDMPNPGMEPALHYVLYGELFGKNPSAEFNTTYYRLNRTDVIRRNINVLTHYVNSGRRERLVTNPSTMDWLKLAKRYDYFDDEVYEAEHGPSVKIYADPLLHYERLGDTLGYATSIRFDPTKENYSAISMGKQINKLAFYMEHKYFEEGRLHKQLAKAIANNDLEILWDIAEELYGDFAETAAVSICRALCHISRKEWGDVHRILSTYWRDLTEHRLNIRHERSLMNYLRQPNENFRAVLPSRRPMHGLRICVYTCHFGEIDILPPILSFPHQVDFICFSDRPGTANGWEYRVIDPGMADPNLDAKLFKVLPHRYLSEYDYSLFVDANTFIFGRLKSLLENYLVGNEFVMWVHPERNDIYSEVAAIVEAGRHDPDLLLRQVTDYQAEGLPSHAGMCEASFIWRAHNAERIRTLMEEWWCQILKYSRRDQLSFAYLIWKHDQRPDVLPSELGTSRENEYFAKLPHVNSLQQRVLGSGGTLRGIWVLYGARYIHSGATMLRGQQMTKILQGVAPEGMPVFYSSFDKIHSSLVILTKGYVAQHGEPGIRGLKSRDNVVLLDVVDAKLNDNLVRAADGLIASSIEAFRFYRAQWGNVPAYHITHHVDLRLDGSRREFDEAKIGYFGELVNTERSPKLEKLIDFVPVDTSRMTTDWIEKLPRYNCHYAVRKSRGIDGYKPFLKGFVAAHYRSNIIVQSDKGDSTHYLGSDYPYLLKSDAGEQDIFDVLHFVSESFGGPEWRYGMEIMDEVRNRSSLEYVRMELRSMLNDVLGKAHGAGSSAEKPGCHELVMAGSAS